MADIHASAEVDPKAELAGDVIVGPHCVVGPGVVLGDGVRLSSHVVVDGRTRLGEGCRVMPFAVVGMHPQDQKYRGEPSSLEIGPGTTIREHVTIHTGTEAGGMVTRVGRDCLIMVAAHVAHDCQIGDGVILVNNVTLGGHVKIGDTAMIGGMSAVHQFVRIGHHAMIGGMSGVENDVIPYGTAIGNRAYLSGLNIIGLKRRGFSRDDIHTLRTAYRLLFAAEGNMQERLDDVAEMFASNELVMDIVRFIRADSSRRLCQPRPEQ